MTSGERPHTLYEKIFEGEISAHALYHDTQNGFMAFLDIKPATVGHTLVIPREPVDRVYDLEPARSTQLAMLTQIISQHLQNKLNPLRITEHTLGFQVPHAHRMLIPSYVRGDISFLYDETRMAQETDHESLAVFSEQLAFTAEEQFSIQAKLRRVAGLFIDAT